MKKIYYVLVCLFVLLAFGCQKGPYPYISKEAVKKIDSSVHPAIKNAAFIYQNNIYYVPDFDKPVVQITNDGSAARFVKMSHDHNKFAYLNASGKIVVISSTGAVVTTLTQFTQVKTFDWSADDKTLYILNGNVMAYYGPAMNLPAFSYPAIANGSTLEVLSVSVSMKGDFAYVVHGYNFIDGDKYELVIATANNGQLITYSNPEDDVNTMDYVNFSSNKQDLLVGYKESDVNSDSQQKIDVFTDLGAYPVFSYGGNAPADVCTPVYNSTINYMVAGYINSDDNNTIVPAAIYLGDPPVFQSANVTTSKILTQYSFAGTDLYTDWK